MLPLSDHADYAELVRTARESGARRIYTVHGPERFADRLRALGLPAQHLAAHPQDFCDDDDPLVRVDERYAAPARGPRKGRPGSEYAPARAVRTLDEQLLPVLEPDSPPIG